MKKVAGYILTALILTGYLSCKKPFSPHLTSVTTNFLAVDGPIISGDSTFISLSRTTSLSDTTQNKAELKAIVSVEDDQGTLYNLTEKGKGLYVLGVTNFTIARKYRLDIKTSDGKIYQSDFVPMKVTPQIDSLFFKENSENTVLFYANTHDATNNSRYYRWDYKETWEYQSYYGNQLDTLPYINYIFNSQTLTLAAQNSPLYVGACYTSDRSNEIIIGSSAKLANDVISGVQIGGVAAGSQKISILYNMQLNQYALTGEGYNYYQNLKTNTEETGSIFDAVPSITIGNIHCITSPGERVIGFISASTVTTRMLPVHYNDIPLRNSFNIVFAFSSQLPDLQSYGGPPDPTTCAAGPLYFFPAAADPIYMNVKFGGLILNNPAGTLSQRINSVLSSGQYMITNVAYVTTGGTITTNPIPDNPIPMYTPIHNNTPIGYYYFEKDCVDCRTMPQKGTLTRPAYLPPY